MANSANQRQTANLSRQDFPECDDQTIERERFIAFMRNPSSYPHKPATIRSTETHISWVFFASPFVYKVKKPVNFGFLDFSSLERRHHFCQREIELNRRLAPETYCGVLPIYRKGETFLFQPNGEIAEYCVQMKELRDGYFLHQLLERGLISAKEISQVISLLHRLYDAPPTFPKTEGWGTPEKLRITTDENLALTEKFVGKTITSSALATVRFFTDTFYQKGSDLLNERVQQDRIRDCHGDLRLEHIHLTPESISIFDCIEFNDRLRFIDTANDLAFLAMDFDFAGRRDLGSLLLEIASREFIDPGLPKVTDFYKCYRAAVRGKVESLEAESCAAAQAIQHANLAKRYFRLALRYATYGSKPTILVVMGPVASGKSTIAKELANELGWPVFSSDRIRKTLANVPLMDRTDSKDRARVYSVKMTTLTYERLLAESVAALGQEGGVVLDATFSRRIHRELLARECAKANAALQIIELDAHPDEIQARLKRRDKSAIEISDARLEDLEKLTAEYDPPVETGTDLIRLSTAVPVSENVKRALLEMAKRQTDR